MSRGLRIIPFVLLLIVCVVSHARSTTITWTGGGADNLASNPDNWSDNAAPQYGDDVVFDTTSTKDCIWDVNIVLSSFGVGPDYTGLITFEAPLIVTGDVNISGGTIKLSTGSLNIGFYQPYLPPSAVTMHATDVSGSGAVLNATINPNGSETTVYFEWGLDTNYGNITEEQVIEGNAGSVSVSAFISNLMTTTTYHYRVVATNAYGTIYGEDVSFITSGGTYLGSTTISEDTIWTYEESPYVVSGTIRVYATLTIEPGVEIRSGSVGIDWEYDDARGRIIAQGTAERPIVFTALNPSKASYPWCRICISSSEPDIPQSIFEHVIVEYGNYGFYISGGSVVIKNSTIRLNSDDGMYINIIRGYDASIVVIDSIISDNADKGIDVYIDIEVQRDDLLSVSGTVFLNNGSYPISIPPDMASGLGPGNTFTGNGTDAIEFRGSGISHDVVWPYQPAPYDVNEYVYISGWDISEEPVLTIDPGVVVRFNGNYGEPQFGIGDPSNRGRLVAQGTADSPVIFTLNRDITPQYLDHWEGIVFYNQPSTENVLEYVRVEYGGLPLMFNYPGNITVSDSSIMVQNSSFNFSEYNGVSIIGNSLATIFNSTISDNMRYGIYIDDTSDARVRFSVISNNTEYAIYADSSSVLELRHSDIIGNGGGIYSNTDNSAVDARFNWWGDPTGPSGEGPGVGQSVTGVFFEPWLGGPHTYPFYILTLSASVEEFSPMNNTANYIFSFSEEADWVFEIKDPGGTIVRTFNGSGNEGMVSWDGRDEGGNTVPDGTYIYQLTATSLNDGSVAAPLIGDVDVGKGLPIAEITFPVNGQLIGTSQLNITGTAKDVDFKRYKIEYGLGTAPSQWYLISSSAFPVENDTLATWNIPDPPHPYYTIKLTVNDYAGNTTTAIAGVRVKESLSINNLLVSNPRFSPNMDGIKDTTTITAEISSDSDWIIDIRRYDGSFIRSFNGTGTSISVTWDGMDEHGVLQSDGEYFFTITATEAGSGAIVNLKGPYIVIDTTPPDAVNDLTLTDVHFDSVNLIWTAVGDDGSTGFSAASYDIRYGTFPLDESTWGDAIQVNGEPPPAPPGTTESFNIEGLTPEITYYFAIKVMDKAGNSSGLSNVVSIKTLSPPALEINPSSISDTLTEGETSTHVLTLSNNGGDTLSYKIYFTNIISPQALQMAYAYNIVPATHEISSGQVETLSIKISENMEFSEGEIIVKFAPGIARTDIPKSIRENINATIKRRINRLDMEVWKVPVTDKAKLFRIIKVLNKNPNVLYAEPNYVYRAIMVPDDPLFSELWGLHNTGQTGGILDADIDAPEAWNLFRGTSEVIVAVIDTGVDYTHADLAANMWINQDEVIGNGIDDDGNGYIDDIYGYDFAYDDPDPMDGHSHGTHCAGTIGAIGNNGIGVTGVNHNVSIMAVKFLNDDGWGYTDDAVSAILYAVDNGAHILSNSWGGAKYSQALKDAISYANNNDVLFIAAAGNDSLDNDIYPFYPSSYDVPNIVSVAATDSNDQLAWFSNYGLETVDLGAPGVSILSTVPDNAYASYSGTSMATPHVSGVAAILKGYNPELTALEIKELIMEGVDSLPSLEGLTVTGGRLNLYKALMHLIPPWIQLNGLFNGKIQPSSSVELTVILNAADQIEGDYGVDIVIQSNDPEHPSVVVPVTLTVLPDTKPPATVNDLIVTEYGSTTVTLQWTAVGDDGYTGRAKVYDIRYSTSPLNESTWNTATQVIGEPEPAEPYTQETFQITGLDPQTRYWIGMKVIDNMGLSSGLSNVVEVFLGSPPVIGVEPSVMPDVALEQGKTTTEILTINNTGEADLTFTIDTGVSWLAPDITSGTVAFQDFVNIGLTYSAVGLFPGNYTTDILITSNDPVNPEITVSATLTVIPSPIPLAPSDLVATVVSSTQIDLSWTDNASNEEGFYIERKTGEEGYAVIAIVGADVTTYSDTGLTPETTYYYRVKAYNGVGESAYSNEASATTPSAIVPTVSTEPVTDLNGTSVTLNAIVNPNGSETFVYFKWGKKKSYGNETPVQFIGSGTEDVYVSARITGLTPGTKYHYNIFAENIAGQKKGKDKTFTTPPITIEILSPQEGDTINRSDTMVRGGVTNTTGNETGVVVNGVVADVYGNEFYANHVPLEEGENVITVIATDTGGNVAETSITITADTTAPYARLEANIHSGIAPLTTYFSARTFISNTVTSYEIDFEGDGVIDYSGTGFEDISHTYDTEGVYLPTLRVRDSQGNTYTDTIAIVVLNEVELDALLRTKWERMRQAMMDQDIEGALAEISIASKDMYQYNFELMQSILPTIAQDMGDITMIKVKEDLAIYEVGAIIDGTEYRFHIKFIKGLDGIWRIYFF